MVPFLTNRIITEDDILALSPHLAVKRSKRARRVALRMDSANRKVNLVIPARSSLNKAYDFALQHQEWIAAKINDVPEGVPFAEGAVLPILGRDREIIMAEASGITLTDDVLIVPPGRAALNTRVRRFLKEEARATLSALAYEKAAEIGKPIKDIQVRDTKSRWGSCGPDGKLSFSWRLVFAPWESLDYVVAHEVAHLTHMNHSPDFWALCTELSTDYTTGKKWMRDNGNNLLRYGR